MYLRQNLSEEVHKKRVSWVNCSWVVMHIRYGLNVTLALDNEVNIHGISGEEIRGIRPGYELKSKREPEPVWLSR